MPKILFYQIPDLENSFAYDCVPFNSENLSDKQLEKEVASNLINAIKGSFLYNSEINLRSKDVELAPFVSDDPIFAGDLKFNENDDFDGFKITQENSRKVKNIFENMVTILRNPNLVFRYLKSLDEAVGEKMRLRGIEPFDNSPQYLIAGAGSYSLGPWKEGYQPLKKGRILNEELLARENQSGINLDGVALFAGAVEEEDANKFVKDGHIFSEDEQVSKFLLHGKYSHRLFFEIIRQAVDKRELNLNVDDQVLTEKQLLQIMVSTKLQFFTDPTATLAWNAVFDGVEEIISPIKKSLPSGREHLFKNLVLDPNNYNFSSRSPNVLKSLITCFGREELPNLCGYLTDSHYKQVAQMIGKLRDLGGRSLKDVPDDFIYLKVIQAMSTDKNFLPNDIDATFPFTSKSRDKIKETEPFDEGFYSEGIRRKVTAPQSCVESVEYDSIKSYIEDKKNRSR